MIDSAATIVSIRTSLGQRFARLSDGRLVHCPNGARVGMTYSDATANEYQSFLARYKNR